LFTGYSEGDINGLDVIDLGCGTGMFSIGSWMLGADSVYGYDISRKAITVADENKDAFGADVVFEVKDIMKVDRHGDTAVMNPPFGCQTRNADRPFLGKAMELCDTVYSMHMGTTSDFIDEYVTSSGREVCFRRGYKFNIPHTFSFHSKAEHNVDIIMVIIR